MKKYGGSSERFRLAKDTHERLDPLSEHASISNAVVENELERDVFLEKRIKKLLETYTKIVDRYSDVLSEGERKDLIKEAHRFSRDFLSLQTTFGISEHDFARKVGKVLREQDQPTLAEQGDKAPHTDYDFLVGSRVLSAISTLPGQIKFGGTVPQSVYHLMR